MTQYKELDSDAMNLLMQKYDEELIVDSTKDVVHPEPCISFGEKTYQYKDGFVTYPVPVATFGNFSFIQAPPKSKKTFFVSLLVASFLHGEVNGYTDKLKGHRTRDKHVVHFDTEQGNFHASRVFRRPLQMSNKNVENYHTYALRKIDFQDRIKFIEWVLYTKLDGLNDGSIGLVVLDGVADLCADVNNIAEANSVVQHLMKWTAELNCHIVTVIHSNYGSDKPTGHLGSFLEKKTESQISLEVSSADKDLVTVKCKRSRNAPFEDFSFRINKYGLPSIETNLFDILSPKDI